jgi:hypothetical protein
MAVTVKTIEELLVDLSTYLEDENSALTDLNQGSNTHVLNRAVARVAAEMERRLGDLDRDGNMASARGEALDLLLSTFQLERFAGEVATGTMLAVPNTIGLTATINAGETLTVGSLVVTVTQTTFLSGATPPVPIEVGTLGAAYNLAAGTVLTSTNPTLAAGFKFVVGASFNAQGFAVTGLSGGSDPETDDTALTSFQLYIKSLRKATPDAIAYAITRVTGVTRIEAVEFDPAVGWISLYVDDGTSNLVVPTLLRDQIETVFREWRAAGVALRILAQEKLTRAVSLSVKVKPAFATSLVAIETAVGVLVAAELATYTLGQPLYISQAYRFGF